MRLNLTPGARQPPHPPSRGRLMRHPLSALNLLIDEDFDKIPFAAIGCRQMLSVGTRRVLLRHQQLS